jgi:hypothetical protein
MMWCRGRTATAVALLGLALLLGGCVARPPTIAHVHIGHAITGVHVTPDKEGYMTTAQRRAQEAIAAAGRASTSTDLGEIKRNSMLASQASNSRDDFGVKEAIVMAVNHISFAATSDDASLNVQKSAPVFASDSARVVQRCELIELLNKDVQAATSSQEAAISITEMAKLTRANLEGDDSNGDGKVGSAPSEYGLVQLRAELEAMIAREHPKYVTVDRWYLFNLVRLPNGRWVFDKLGRGGNVEGYK